MFTKIRWLQAAARRLLIMPAVLVGLLVVGCNSSDTSGTASIYGVAMEPEERREHTALPINPSTNTNVALLKGNQTVAEQSTQKNGAFLFDNLEPGDYTVVFTHRNSTFPETSLPITLAAGTHHHLTTPPFTSVLLKPNPTERDWTILYYLNGSETSMCTSNMSTLRLMEREQSSSNINLVAYQSGCNTQSAIYYLEQPQFTISPDPIDDFITPPIILSDVANLQVTTEELDPGLVSTLTSFVELGVKHYPARNVMLIISGHGSGIAIEYSEACGPGSGSVQPQSISPNPFTQTTITLPELREALTQSNTEGRISVLGLEACYMGMLEVAYELKSTGIQYLVASEATAPERISSSDWLRAMVSGQVSNPRDIAQTMVTSAANQTNPPSNLNTLAAVDLQRIDSFMPAFYTFAEALKNHAEFPQGANQLREILNRTTRMADEGGAREELYPHYFDLRHFSMLIADETAIQNSILRTAASEVSRLLQVGEQNLIIAFHRKNRESLANAHGLSVLIYDPDWRQGSYLEYGAETYRKHRIYLDGNQDWDVFLTRLAP